MPVNCGDAVTAWLSYSCPVCFGFKVINVYSDHDRLVSVQTERFYVTLR